MSDVGETGDPTESLEMDWSHLLEASRQHYTTSLTMEPRGENEKNYDREIRGAAIWKQTSKKRDTAGDNGRG